MVRSIKRLFVYGTLLSRSRDPIGRDIRWRLSRHCLTRRPAKIPGLLFDLGGYPGWIAQPASNRRVYGEVLLLNDCMDVFSWLDPYEDFDPSRPEEGEYTRVVRQVMVGQSQQIGAWVYGYRGGLDDKHLIPGGSWLDRS